MTVTIDFDGTLEKKNVQKYVKELMQRGIDVWILTARFDELHQHKYLSNPRNSDLWEVIDRLNIPRYKVIFRNMQSKADYLEGTNVLFHLDDDMIELEDIRSNTACFTKGIYVYDNFIEKCEKLLK